MPNSAPFARDQQRVIGRPHDVALLQTGGYRVPGGLPGLFVDNVEDLRERPAQCFRREPAGHAFSRRVQPRDLAFRVGGDHGIPDGFQRHPQQLVLSGQFDAQLAQRRHVPVHAGDAQRLTVGSAYDPASAANVMHRAVGPDHAELRMKVRAALPGFLKFAFGPAAIVG